jgi:hypothetical protein
VTWSDTPSGIAQNARNEKFSEEIPVLSVHQLGLVYGGIGHGVY